MIIHPRSDRYILITHAAVSRNFFIYVNLAITSHNVWISMEKINKTKLWLKSRRILAGRDGAA